MTKVSIREFQKYAQRYLDKLPVILTRYGVPVASVIQFDGEGGVKSVIQKDNLNGGKKPKKNSTMPIENKEINSVEEKERKLKVARYALGKLI